jgi:hypothetical protein
MGDSDPSASPRALRECMSESDISEATGQVKGPMEESEVYVDPSLADVDFSSDFSEGPGRNEIIKAIATRWTWSRYVSHALKTALIDPSLVLSS